MRAGRKHMENQNKIFKPRIEMPVISAIFFSGIENDQKLTFSKILKIDQSETELLVAVMFVNSFDRNE
jgi:hypothetical protein